MKWKYPLALLFPLSLFATLEQMPDYEFVTKETMFHFDFDGRIVGREKFRTPTSVQGSKIKYAEGWGSLFISHWIEENSALSWQIGYQYFQYNWPQNPTFPQKTFNNFVTSIALVTYALEDWKWIASLGVRGDLNHINFGDWATYYGMLWGRYTLYDILHFHLGFVGHVGYRNKHLYPIIGLDWRFAPKWQLNLIFPFDMSLMWDFSKWWSLGAEWEWFNFGQTYRMPQRVHQDGFNVPTPVVQYFSQGLGLKFGYHHHEFIRMEIGGGWNFGGWTLIKGANNANGIYYKFKGAGYAKASLSASF